MFLVRRAPVHPVPVFMFERFADRCDGEPQSERKTTKLPIISAKKRKVYRKRRNSMRGDLYLESVADMLTKEDINKIKKLPNAKKKQSPNQSSCKPGKKKRKPVKKANTTTSSSTAPYRPYKSSGSAVCLKDQEDDGTLSSVLQIRSVSDTTNLQNDYSFSHLSSSNKLAKILKSKYSLEQLLHGSHSKHKKLIAAMNGQVLKTSLKSPHNEVKDLNWIV
jgi:hypothetical protein